MPTDRRRVRILAMQALCQWEVQKDGAPEAVRGAAQTQETPEDQIDEAVSMIACLLPWLEEIDARLTAASQHWDLARISPVERNVMRVAVAEWMQRSVPPLAALDEAIEIAREYGGVDSPRFVNGVLDAVLKRMEEPPRELD